MSAGGPDLFVICKSCGSEVSPYITECPYCGNRLRKRAPKIDRDGRVAERPRRRPSAPSLPRLRSGEIPGIRVDSRPYATMVLVLLGLAGTLLERTAFGVDHLVVAGQPTGHWWRVATSTLLYDNTGYAVVTLFTIAVFGWLLERRHGPLPVLLLFLIGGIGGTAATTAAVSSAVVLGAGGAALAMVIAWALPDALAVRAGEEIDGDLLGAAVVGVVVALMPLAAEHASWVADGVGAVGGLAVGLPLARVRSRD